jgi:NAD(P)-dependent dehydrogenase (short-subunit alcohol dehydrogenase family)
MHHPTALITGASAGIGRAIALRLASEGLRVITLDRRRPDEILDRETYVEADLSDAEATRTLLARLVAEHEVAALVNNVGAVRPGALEEATLADLQAVVALNLGVALLCTQAVVPRMKARGFGRIVNISSRAALGKELRSVYAATKAGLHGLTRTWALELAPHGITVNAVGPGPIETEMFRHANPADSPRTRAIMEAIPVRRMGQPEDVAHAVAGFTDLRAGFITGQVIYVCGGMTIASA